MDKRTFKSSFHYLLNEEVDGLTSERKLKYMKKWIREFENDKEDYSINSTDTIHIDNTKKIGVLVRTTLDELIREKRLTPEKLRLLQDERHCKNLFDINYPMFKKVAFNIDLLEQRRINGYYRYWAEPVTIHYEKYLVCNDWYERNKSKFIIWAESINK